MKRERWNYWWSKYKWEIKLANWNQQILGNYQYSVILLLLKYPHKQLLLMIIVCRAQMLRIVVWLKLWITSKNVALCLAFDKIWRHGLLHPLWCTVVFSKAFFLDGIAFIRQTLFVTRSGKTNLICTRTEINFLSVHESCTHALPRNTKYLNIDGRVCFHRLPFADMIDAVKLQAKDEFLGPEGY